MNRTDHILQLNKTNPELNSVQVAERVGCHPSYVRTTWHRNGIFKQKHNPEVVYRERTYIRIKEDEYRRLLQASIKVT